MSNETAVALARVLADYDHAFIQTLIAQQGDRTGKDPSAADKAKSLVRDHLEELAGVSDSAIILNAITTDSRTPNNHRQALAWMKDARDRGFKIYPQCVTSGGGFTFTFADGGNM